MATDYDATATDAAMAQAPVQNEVQTLTITGTPTGGDFTITYAGQTTSAIAYNASAATVDTALEALSNIGAGDVTCTGGPLPGTAVVITFTGALAETNVALMTADGAGLTGGTTPDATIALTTTGYGAEKNALNAGIDTLGALIETHRAAFAEPTYIGLYEHLYELARLIGDGLKDQTS